MTEDILCLFLLYYCLYSLYNFILFVHSHHVNFNFNQSSTVTECCFQLWKRIKGSNSQNRFLWDSHPQIKSFVHSKICNCPHLVEFTAIPEHHSVKPWISHFYNKRIFKNLKKLLKVKINFVYLCIIMLNASKIKKN